MYIYSDRVNFVKNSHAKLTVLLKKRAVVVTYLLPVKGNFLA
jgi:hypothetical protein